MKKHLFKLLAVLFFSIQMGTLKAQVIFEAEDAYISAGKVDTKHPGYTGDGFADTDNTIDVYIEWTFNSFKSVSDSIGFRYALGKDQIRSMKVMVNDDSIGTINFGNTVEFTTYLYKKIYANIIKGENKIKLVAIDTLGAPNIDHMTVNCDTNVYLKIDTASIGNGSINIAIDSFLYGSRISVEALAVAGNVFQNWSGDIVGSNNPLTFTVDKPYSLTANFFNTMVAFPGAEGFGRNITGGRGGTVIQVTNLNDAGPGSLRDAVNQTGSRTIVFTVSGTIELASKISISKGNLTIAGQTAPGDGITLSGYTLTVSADNVIIRYIRSRLGSQNLVEDDAMNGKNQTGVILDHCTMSWSVDETASFYDNSNFTMQYCLISESLYKSIHVKDNHGYGGIWGGKGATFHHNLLAHHTSRNPRFCGSRYSMLPDQEKIDYRNNVIFNWGFNSVYGAEGGSYNIVNNYYKSGPATSSGVKYRILNPNAQAAVDSQQPAGTWGEFFVDGNYVNGNASVTANNWLGVDASGVNKDDIKSLTEYDFDTVTTHTAEIAFEHVVAQAGVCIPKRDIIDERIVQETLLGKPTYGTTYGAGTGIIDNPSDVGGYPVLVSGTAPTDTDKDGMPDSWETARSLNPNDATDRNGDDNNNGYTNLEEYLNELVAKYTYIIRPLSFEITSSSETEVVLAWNDVVDNETGFLLERKGINNDYEQIAKIAANKNSYTDAITSLDSYTYRLRAYNAVDTSYYTDTAYVQFVSGIKENMSVTDIVEVYPNPFNEQIVVNLTFVKGKDALISIISLTGQTVFTTNVENSGSTKQMVKIDSDKLPSGIYLISVQTEENKFVKKIMKK